MLVPFSSLQIFFLFFSLPLFILRFQRSKRDNVLTKLGIKIFKEKVYLLIFNLYIEMKEI